MFIVATKEAARQVPGGLFVRFFGPSYQAPREKKPSNASTRTTIRMIQRMLNVPPLALLKQKRPEGRFGYERKPKLRWAAVVPGWETAAAPAAAWERNRTAAIRALPMPMRCRFPGILARDFSQGRSQLARLAKPS